MQVLKLKSMTTAAAAAAASLGQSLAALAGPPVTGGFNAAQDAVRMSISRQTMLAPPNAAATPKVAATKQKATTATHSTGQPNQTCGSPTVSETPGHAASAPGSAFNPNGKAGTVYAGTRAQNSKHPTSAAQYDVACSHQRVLGSG
jgi:hypothetical protein